MQRFGLGRHLLPKGQEEEIRLRPVRCEQCGAKVSVVIRECRVCARCGAVWPVQERREVASQSGAVTPVATATGLPGKPLEVAGPEEIVIGP